MELIINHRLGKQRVKFFNNFSVTLKYDSIASTFGIDFYFDPKNQEHAEMACVSHFHECILQHNGEILITGFILSNTFKKSSQKQLAKIGGYSKTGVLEDCDIPTDIELQSDGLTLREITQKIISKFHLKLKVDGSVKKESNTVFTLDEKLDKTIKKTTAPASVNIKSYLTELAVQRNIILSHDKDGNLLFTEAKVNLEPLFHVEDGVIATDIEMTFNGQGIHSHITVVKTIDSEGGNTDSNEYTIQNPYCPVAYVYRPKVVIQSSGDTNTIEEYAKNILAAELKNIKLRVEIDRWEMNGKLIRPNNIITVFSPENFIYKKTRFLIESITFTGNEKAQTAVLNCVLPQVYNRQTPKNIFVDTHKQFPRI